MPPPGSSTSGRGQRVRAVRKNVSKESGSEYASAPLSSDSEVNEIINGKGATTQRGGRRSFETVDGPLGKMKGINARMTATLVELYKVPGALVREVFSLAGEYEVLVTKLLA